MTNGLVANELTVAIFRITFGNSLIDCTQVQVDSILRTYR